MLTDQIPFDLVASCLELSEERSGKRRVGQLGGDPILLAKEGAFELGEIDISGLPF